MNHILSGLKKALGGYGWGE